MTIYESKLAQDHTSIVEEEVLEDQTGFLPKNVDLY